MTFRGVALSVPPCGVRFPAAGAPGSGVPQAGLDPAPGAVVPKLVPVELVLARTPELAVRLTGIRA